MTERTLYSYFRSSAAYRVRIALNIKGLVYQQRSIRLLKGEQRSASFMALNPQGLVPVLDDGGIVLNQSLAICEYLDEAYPDTVPLLPRDTVLRAQARAIAQWVASEIHPLNNLRVLTYLTDTLELGEQRKSEWYHHWIEQGFIALEHMLGQFSGRYALGDQITLADICLVPQVFNAERFSVDLTHYPRLTQVVAALNELPAFVAAHPTQQPDAV